LPGAKSLTLVKSVAKWRPKMVARCWRRTRGPTRQLIHMQRLSGGKPQARSGQTPLAGPRDGVSKPALGLVSGLRPRPSPSPTFGTNRAAQRKHEPHTMRTLPVHEHPNRRPPVSTGGEARLARRALPGWPLTSARSGCGCIGCGGLCWATRCCGEGCQLAHRPAAGRCQSQCCGHQPASRLRGRSLRRWALDRKAGTLWPRCRAAPPMRPSTASSTVAAVQPIIRPSRDSFAAPRRRWPVSARCSAARG